MNNPAAPLVTLSNRQRQVLGFVQNRADVSAEEAAKTLRLKPYTVRRDVQFLKEVELIHKIPVINHHAFGYNEYDLFFSLRIAQERQRAAVLKWITQHPSVSRLEQLGGDFEFQLAIFVRSAEEVGQFWENLGAKFGNVVSNKNVSEILLYTGFGRKYLDGKPASPIITLSRSKQIHQLDAVDHKILRALVSEPVGSLRSIAGALEMQPATLEYRLQNLRKAGVFLGFIYGVRAHKLGRSRFRMLVRASGITSSLRRKLFEFCAAEIDVVNAVRCLGAWDYIIQVETQRDRDLLPIRHRLQAVFGDQLDMVTPHTLFDSLKVVVYPFA